MKGNPLFRTNEQWEELNRKFVEENKLLRAELETARVLGSKMSKKKQKTYTGYFRVVVETSVDFSAENYEQALVKAREYGVKDIVEFDSDFNDGSVALIGLYNHTEEPHK